MLGENFESFWLALPLLGLCVSIWLERYFTTARLSAILLSFLVAAVLYEIPFPTLLLAPIQADLLPVGVLLLLWVAYGHLCAAAGGIRRVGPWWLYPFLCGLLMGEWGAALFFAARVRESSALVRLILASSTGAFLGVIGKPSLLLLGGALWLVPLSLLLLVLSFPKKEDLAHLSSGSWWVTLICMSTWTGAFFSDWWALGLGALALVPFAHRGLPWRSLLRDGALVLGAIFLTSWAAINGLIEQSAWYLEGGVLNTQGEIEGPIFLFFSLFSCATDPFLGALYAEAFLDRALDLERYAIDWLSLGASSIGGTCFLLAFHRCLGAAKRRLLGYLLLFFIYFAVRMYF